ncbi:MAG: hexosaminidase [Granulosicoccus sp.]|jgi:hexosaminidase
MKNLLFLFSICLLLISCEEKIPATPKDLAKEFLIPKPDSLLATGSSFRLTNETQIIIESKNEKLEKVGQFLVDKLKTPTGFNFPINFSDKTNTPNAIHFFISKNKKQLGEEGYELTIKEDFIQLEGNSAAGVFRGVQTLLQLLPASIEKGELQTESWEIASGTIYDSPTYEYRGAMIDVSRHFFDVEKVKEYIDHLARYKMNYLHIHLTDDQGWRIEIKKWPNLTKHGGSTQVGGGKGGFYTQEDYKEIVKYAADRFITIVPEIDLPGHTNAALAAYGELNCDGKARDLYTGMEVGFSTLCTRNEKTYEFVDDVIKELVAMTPGPYIHIGGDESHSTKKEDYIYFVDRVQDIVAKHGKMMMGWDEVTEIDLKSNSIAQYWAEKENAQAAVRQNVKVLMSPASKAYLDMKYDSTTTLGLNWAGYIEVDSGYIWNPATLVKGVSKENILGVECPLWTETVTNMDELEYLVFPRLLGYAEIGWTKQEDRNWEDYKTRLGNHQARLEALGINYYPSKLVPWAKPMEEKVQLKN